MIKLSELSIQQLLKADFVCECRKKHTVDIDRIIIENNALKYLPEVIRLYTPQKLLVVADNNTYKIAGKKVEDILKASDYKFKTFVFQGEKQLEADEKSLGRLLFEVEDETDLIIAVGSGTINDISRFVSTRIGIPYVFVATAPSMDGYASPVAPVVIDRMKLSPVMGVPKAIVADIDIIKNAPMRMIAAGLGDMLGKYTALCDWELSHIIKGEYICGNIVELVKKSINKCICDIEGIKNRDERAIKNLVEGLVLSGIGMLLAGNSRPAAGTEHFFSHFWEMLFLMDGKEPILHGTKVGIGTVAAVKMFELLKTADVNFEYAAKRVETFDYQEWTSYIYKIYRTAAPSVIALEKETQNNFAEKHRERLEMIKEHWDEIVKTVSGMIPATEEIETILKSVQGPVSPFEVGIGENELMDAIKVAKDSRDKYTLLHLLWDLGLEQEFANSIRDYFAERSLHYR